MLLDSAMYVLLASGATPAAPMRPTVHMQANCFHPHIYPNQLNPTEAALLMSPLPVVTHLMRQAQAALLVAAQQGASNLLDLARGDEDSDMSVDSTDTVSTTAMVGTAAAAMALMSMRRPPGF